MGNTVLKLIKTLHERKTRTSVEALAVYEAEDGSRVYGVVRNGEICMTGTKAEAKSFYGSWRKTC